MTAGATFQRSHEPSRFNYPGAPHPRWWHIEDALVDIGGFPPDRSHFPTLLLLDLILTHSNDWFTFYLDAQIGDVVRPLSLTVVDLFHDTYSSDDDPRLRAPDHWSLFAIKGWPNDALPLWPVAAAPLTGEPLEQVALGVDEDANLMWAVEERVNGRMLAGLEFDAPSLPVVSFNSDHAAASTNAYVYQAGSFTPHHWHPYILDEDKNVDKRRFIQARLAEYRPETGQQFRLAPEPAAELLTNPARTANDPVHAIEPRAVSVQGMRLDRRYVLGRRSDGQPVLWIQRRRLPLLSPPANRLRFDVIAAAEKL